MLVFDMVMRINKRSTNFISVSLSCHYFLCMRMQPQILSSMSWSFIFVTIISFRAPTSVLPDDSNSCIGPFECGNIQHIGYPFWRSNPACGYPDSSFQLNCSDQTPLITIMQLTYQVLGIDYENQILKVARTDYTQNICPTFLLNTTLNTNLFGYTFDTQTITLYYQCPPIDPIPGLLTQFNCTINGTDSYGYYTTKEPSSLGSLAENITRYLNSCTDSVMVPANEWAIQSLESNLSQESLIRTFDGGFGLLWKANNSLCESCQLSGGRCGQNQTTGAFICYCRDQPYAPTCGTFPRGFWKTHWRVTIAIAIPTVMVLSIILIYFSRSDMAKRSFLWKNTKHNEIIEMFMVNHQSLTAKRYSYSDIKKMTNSFVDKLGQGGFGGVYKGKLPDGRLVAVKVLNESKGDGQDFINEVASISKTSHVNIVTLLGFCYERTKRALIYEYMPHGSLDKFIQGEKSPDCNRRLEWGTLYEIAVGIARGLEYLHRGCNTRIVHFDIKPHNILLDEDFCPKISDFGLAKLCKRKESKVSMTGARGTAGYIAPEVFFRKFGGVSYKSDVYSYGMMVLEIVGGSKNYGGGLSSQTGEIYFPDWIYKHLESSGHVSTFDGVITGEEEETLRKMMIVGLWCIQSNPSDRPSMTKVVEMLEGNFESLEIPPKPLLSSPTRSPEEQYSMASSPTNASSQIDEQKILSLYKRD